MKNYKISKQDIEDLAREIIAFLKKHCIYDDVCIYYNDKRWEMDAAHYDEQCKSMRYEEVIRENMNPLMYFEYANDRHILSMSFEGALYDILNYNASPVLADKFEEIFSKRDLYYEFGNDWNLTVFPAGCIEYDEIEYTPYETDPEPEHIYQHKEDVLPELKCVMDLWYSLSKITGDKGGCVVGAGMHFTYKNIRYIMSPCSPYQGELSWTPHVEFIKQALEALGATDVVWYCGRLD